MQNVCNDRTDRNMDLKERITVSPMHTHSRPILVILLIIMLILLPYFLDFKPARAMPPKSGKALAT